MSDDTSWMDREVPLAEAQRDAASDPVLARMIRRGVPLTRYGWLIQSGLAPDPEEGWTAEHEMSVPPCFRDDRAFAEPDPRAAPTDANPLED